MQLKKLIPGALLLAAVGAAHAEVSVYGLVDLRDSLKNLEPLPPGYI